MLYFCWWFLQAASLQGPRFRFCSGQPRANSLQKDCSIFSLDQSSPAGSPKAVGFLCPVLIHEIHKLG
ncbi:hypothetical protein XELAEV_18033892mg [Xenopus laevis]|uniref:Uncharacterized protein n=1 Tax=Xenopus laevis TaxID=8355 RepID=A0A974CK90_XENLA|nr:hypothetical protein XELAEV_18033892mg [Xenopus laevis]